MKRLLVPITAFALTACVAKNEVLTRAEWEDSYGNNPTGGVVFSLPQARLRFDYSLDRHTFTAGAHTNVVDYCASELADSAFKDPLCQMFATAGINGSLRFSTPEDRVCISDGGNKETRIGIGEGATLTTEFVPDERETYIIPLKRSFFQNFDFGLELNDNGTVGKGSITTENLGTQDLLSAAAEIVVTVLGAAPDDGLDEKEPADDEKLPVPDKKSLEAAEKALRDLLELRRKRDEIAARNHDAALPSRAVQLAALDKQIAELHASLVGKVASEKQADNQAYWLPAAPGSWDERLLFASWIGQGFGICGVKTEFPGKRFAALIRGNGEALAPLSSGRFGSAVGGEARGWPYRVPREVDVEWHVCEVSDEATDVLTMLLNLRNESVPKCRKLDGVRMRLPQFGITMRLPEATGGRKSSIAPEYYIDGSLKKLTISHVGESPAPVIAAFQTTLTPKPEVAEPTEVAELTAEASLISARQALCRLVFAVSPTDPLCLGPNPPTARPNDN